MYYWFPKVTGKLYFERPGQISFWILFVGTNLLFFPMHIVGLLGMPRRVYTYPSGLGWGAYNLAETIGGFVTLAGILLLLGNLVVSYFRGAPAGPDPWHGPTLEWTTSSPPPDVQLRGHPEGLERLPELGRRRPRRTTAEPRRGRGDARRRAPAAGGHARRRRPGRDRRDAARLAVAVVLARGALARLHDARAPAVRRGGRLRARLPARARSPGTGRSRRA